MENFRMSVARFTSEVSGESSWGESSKTSFLQFILLCECKKCYHKANLSVLLESLFREFSIYLISTLLWVNFLQ